MADTAMFPAQAMPQFWLSALLMLDLPPSLIGEMRMRKALTLLMFAVWASGSTVAHAAYVIKLKNGNEYVTGRYWQEGTQVLFDTYGGVFGIERGFVTTIEKTDNVIQVATVAVQDPSEKPQSDSAEHSKEPQKTAPGAEAKTAKTRDPDDPIVAEFNRLNDKSKQVNGMLTEEIRELLKGITAFKNKLSRDAKLFIEYGREFNELQEFGAAAETELRSRSKSQ